MIVERLADCELFKDLLPAQRDEFFLWLHTENYRDGQEILSEGQSTNDLYLLMSGSVSVVKSSEYGRVRLAEIRAPSFFGEIGLLGQRCRSAAVRANGSVGVGRLTGGMFNSLIYANNVTALRIALNLSRILARRLSDTTESLATNTALILSSAAQSAQR